MLFLNRFQVQIEKRDFLSVLDFLWKISRVVKPRNPYSSVDEAKFLC